MATGGTTTRFKRPESIYTWMRGANANELLTGPGTRDIARARTIQVFRLLSPTDAPADVSRDRSYPD